MKWLIAYLLVCARLLGAPFTVATYNLELYVDRETFGTPPKSAESRQMIRRSIKQLNADVIALQEVGSTAAFDELRTSLRAEGVDYPHAEYLQALDSNLHLAFLSKVPIVGRRRHTNEAFLFEGRRFHVARGFAEIEVQTSGGRLTLITAHLKSKRQTAEADEQGLREEEAARLRERIDEFFARESKGRLLVLGDFNDQIGSRTLRTIIGRGQKRLFDPRPAERNGDSLPNPNLRFEPRRIVWTHYFARDETYSRLDYILLSPALQNRAQTAYVLASPDWGTASDHRPVCVKLNL